MNDTTNEIKRLKFEELLWIIFAIISLLNVYGDKIEEEYVTTNQETYQDKSNKIFKITLIVTLLIYIYFFIRNYKALEKASYHEKRLYEIKLLGSSFLIAGILLLIYFQTYQNWIVNFQYYIFFKKRLGCYWQIFKI